MDAGWEAAQTAERRARLQPWRREHPRATFDEIEDAVQLDRVQVQAQLVAAGIGPAPVDTEPVAETGGAECPICPACGGPMRRSGQRTRTVLSRRGQPIPLERTYFVCPACRTGRTGRTGLFPWMKRWG